MLVPTSAQLAAYGYDEACRLGAVYSNQTTCAHQIFWAAQHAADASIKVLTDGLRARNLWTSTVVCLSTDNGPEEMMVYTNGVGSTGPFRGRKRSLYEGGVRLPFIMLYPGHGRKGVVEHTVAGAVDWLPTVMSLAGVTMPPAIAETARGYDLSGLLLDSTLGKSVHVGRRVDSRADGTPSLAPPSSAFDRPAGKPLFWEWRFPVAGPCWNEAPQLAVRTGRYKLYLNPPMSPGGTPTRVELYDVGVGSGDGTPTMLFEMQNIAAQLPEVVSNLTAQVLAWHAALPPGPVDSHPGCPGRGGPWWQTSELLDAESSTAVTPEIVIEDDPAVLL
jgi:N-acetylgalactosamine-6-sulfatase